MKRELATLPADLPHAFQEPDPNSEGTCQLCDREVGADLHRELVIEKATAPVRLAREKGV